MIDPETPIPVLRRFNVKTLEQDYDDCTVVASRCRAAGEIP